MKIIGITGTLGAGKGTIVEYLVAYHGYTHFSVRNYLIKLIADTGKLVNRDSMVEMANGLRAKHGPSYIVEELFKEAQENGTNAIIESIRTVGEIYALREKGNFMLVSVDTDSKIRYDRIVARASETDMVSFEVFIENENREMTSTDPNKQNLSACMALADFHLNNNGTFEELYQQINQLL